MKVALLRAWAAVVPLDCSQQVTEFVQKEDWAAVPAGVAYLEVLKAGRVDPEDPDLSLAAVTFEMIEEVFTVPDRWLSLVEVELASYDIAVPDAATSAQLSAQLRAAQNATDDTPVHADVVLRYHLLSAALEIGRVQPMVFKNELAQANFEPASHRALRPVVYYDPLGRVHLDDHNHMMKNLMTAPSRQTGHVSHAIQRAASDDVKAMGLREAPAPAPAPAPLLLRLRCCSGSCSSSGCCSGSSSGSGFGSCANRAKISTISATEQTELPGAASTRSIGGARETTVVFCCKFVNRSNFVFILYFISLTGRSGLNE